MNLLAGGGMETIEPSTPSASSTYIPKFLNITTPAPEMSAKLAFVQANWIWVLLVIIIILGIFFVVRNRGGVK